MFFSIFHATRFAEIRPEGGILLGKIVICSAPYAYLLRQNQKQTKK